MSCGKYCGQTIDTIIVFTHLPFVYSGVSTKDRILLKMSEEKTPLLDNSKRKKKDSTGTFDDVFVRLEDKQHSSIAEQMADEVLQAHKIR